jgi:uncharacterized protein YciI
MPQFILIAHDATDAQAPQRRQDSRSEHLRTIAELRDNGNVICGVAITDENDAMKGSVIITNFETRAQFDTWLANDPYTVNKVWGETTVYNGKLAPTFLDLITKGPTR